MGVSEFFENGIATLGKIGESAVKTSQRENLSLLKLLAKAIKDTSLGAYYVFLKGEIDALTKKQEINEVKNETSHQVAYLIGGYYLSPSVLLPIKEKLEQEGISVKVIDKRYYSKNSIKLLVSNLDKKIKEDSDKDVVLFGYSVGGIIAHRIGSKKGLSTVSFGISENPAETMVGTLLSLTKTGAFKSVNIPENGTNIIETFSAMVPNTDTSENSIRLKDVYSHMAIGRGDVVEEIVKKIVGKFKRGID